MSEIVVSPVNPGHLALLADVTEEIAAVFDSDGHDAAVAALAALNIPPEVALVVHASIPADPEPPPEP